jgi:hypothetical protein
VKLKSVTHSRTWCEPKGKSSTVLLFKNKYINSGEVAEKKNNPGGKK